MCPTIFHSTTPRKENQKNRKNMAESSVPEVGGIREMFRGTFPQLMAVISGTIVATSDGMQYGWSAPLASVILAPDSPVNVTENDIKWFEGIYMIGGVAGLPITILAVDNIGRQKAILGAICLNLISWILIAIATSAPYIYVARFICGIAGNVDFVAAPMYIAEIADQKIRGFLAGIIYLQLLFGILVIYTVGPFVPVYISSSVGIAICLLGLLTFPFMPESPYYLLAKNKKESAKKALQRLRQRDDIEQEFDDITLAVARQKTERGRPQDLILIKSNRKALTIMFVLNCCQHFSSITVLLMNLHEILEAAGSIYIDSKTAAIIFSVIMLISAGAASFVVDKYGRKILLTISSLLTGLCLLAIAVYFTVKSAKGIDYVAGISWIPVASIMIYAAVFKFGLGIVPIVMTAELFPAKSKAMGMTLSDAFYLIFGFLSILLYQTLASEYGIHVPFYVFSASCLFTAAFSIFYIPETKGKTLEEIQFILKGEPYPTGTDDITPS